MKLRDWLRREKVSQAEMAAKLEIAQATVSRICKGDYPGPDTMRRIAIVTKGAVMPNDFFDFEFEEIEECFERMAA